jgi:predicted ATPase
MRHKVEATLDHAEAAIRLGQRHGLPSWTILATALRGWPRTEQGHAADGLAQLHDGTAQWQRRGFVHFAPFLLALQADACLKLAMLDETAATLAQANTIAHHGDRYWTAELHRLEGELARAEGRRAREAEAHFRQAITTARAQAARMLELRATTSLARLWRDEDRHQDARQLLSEIYDWFEEGLDSWGLRAAAALLDTLA